MFIEKDGRFISSAEWPVKQTYKVLNQLPKERQHLVGYCDPRFIWLSICTKCQCWLYLVFKVAPRGYPQLSKLVSGDQFCPLHGVLCLLLVRVVWVHPGQRCICIMSS